MSDPAQVGKAIGENWVLITGLVGVLTGAVSAVGSAALMTGRIMSAMDKRTEEKILLALNNGAGQRIKELIKLGVLEALDHHRDTCPAREDLDNLRSRLDDLSGEWRLRK